MRGLLYLLAFFYDALTSASRTYPQEAPTTPRPPAPPLPTPEEDRKRDRKNDLAAKATLAEYRISRLRQLSGNVGAFEAQVQQARTLLNQDQFDQCEPLIESCTRDIEQATREQAWHRQLVGLTYFLTGQREDLTAVQTWNQTPPLMVTTRAEDALTVAGLDDTARFLLQAAHEDIIRHDTCAGRWQHFIYPRLPNYKRAIELADARLTFASAKFGSDSAQVLLTLTDLAMLHNQYGMYYGVPNLGATRQEARAKQAWECEQYATGWRYAAEVLQTCDRLFGEQDDRTQTALVRLMMTTRPKSLTVPEELQRRLDGCKEKTFGYKKPAPEDKPAA